MTVCLYNAIVLNIAENMRVRKVYSSVNTETNITRHTMHYQSYENKQME